MLLGEGQYANRCPDSDIYVDDSTAQTGALCAEQTNALTAMFTMAQFWLSFASLPVGIALDNIPKPFLLSLCAILEIAGLILLAISDTTDPDHPDDQDHFLVAYSLLALGGCMTMLSAFPASFLLKPYQAGILASISCLFDASSIVFFALKQLQDAFGLSRRNVFLAYACFAVVGYASLISCWYILEQRNWQQLLEEEEDEQEKLSATADVEGAPEEPATAVDDPHFLAHIKRINAMPVMEQLRTVDFGLAVLFASVHMLRCNYFIMTVDAFTLSLGDYDATYAGFFSWILPCGVIFVPFIERTVTQLGVVKTLHFANIVGTVFGVVLFVPMLPVQAVNFAIFTCFRAYLYATLNTMVAVTFGIATMGRIIGCVFTTAAIVSLATYPMAVATEVDFDGDYLPVNVLLVCLSLLPIGATFAYGAATSRQETLPPVVATKSSHHHSIRAPTAMLFASPGRTYIDSIRNARLLLDESDSSEDEGH
jgi:hypothetical protein